MTYTWALVRETTDVSIELSGCGTWKVELAQRPEFGARKRLPVSFYAAEFA